MDNIKIFRQEKNGSLTRMELTPSVDSDFYIHWNYINTGSCGFSIYQENCFTLRAGKDSSVKGADGNYLYKGTVTLTGSKEVVLEVYTVGFDMCKGILEHWIKVKGSYYRGF